MDKLINEHDQITRWPKKAWKKLVITFLGTKFENNHIYSEKEINRMIENHHLFEDTTLLRRELISQKILSRHDDGTKYWKIHEIKKSWSLPLTEVNI